MAHAAPSGRPVPNYRSARLFGIFNVVFASAILVCGLCYGAYLVAMPSTMRAMGKMQESLQQKIEAQRKDELKAVAEQEKAATTEAEKEQARARRQQIEAQPNVNITGMGTFDFSKLMNNPTLIQWYWVEIVTGLILNVMLLASGIGLVQYRGWGRSLGVWAAWGKILRLILVYGFFTVVIVPPFSKTMGEVVGKMMTQQQEQMGRKGVALPTDMLARTYAVTYTVMGVGMIIFGSIYPAVLIWFLTRPGVTAACAAPPTAKPKTEPNGLP